MNRSEALEAQRRVLSRGLHRMEPELLGRSGTAEVAAEAATPHLPVELAVGVQGKGDDFSLAVRSPRDGEDVRRAVEAMREEGPVNLQVVGPIVALAKPWYQTKVRPLWPGSSAAYWRASLGTLGCFVTRRDDPDRQPHVLSNNHVLAYERENLDPRAIEWIYQPAYDDDDDGDHEGDRIGELSHWIPLKTSANEVDAAIARLDDGIAWQAGVLDGLGNLQGVRPADLALSEGDPVHKVGRTTGTTTGRIKAQALTPLPVRFRTKSRSFFNVLEIESDGGRPFCERGDSGSLVVDEDLRAVALLFAKADEAGTGYANPIHRVLDLLSVDLILGASN